jgi:hypothetical protein
MGLRHEGLKLVLAGVCVIFWMAACTGGKPATRCEPPAWLFEKSAVDGIKTGAGEGATPDAATASAMNEISSQISTWVSSRTQVLAERNGQASESRFHHQVELESKHRLNNAKRLNMTHCGDTYYVKYAVDLRPPEVVVAEALGADYPGMAVRFVGSPALTDSPFADDVKRFIPRPDNPEEKGGVIVLPLDLTYTGGIWCVHAGRQTIPVSDVSNLVNLGVYVTGDTTLELCDKTGAARPLTLKTGDEVFFAIPGGAGFYSLFNIYADGRVSVVASNVPMKKSRTLFPDPAGRHVLQAGTIDPKTPSVDTYLLVISKKAQDMTPFSALHDNGKTVSGDDSFSAHILARWLDGIHVKKVALVKTRTEP